MICNALDRGNSLQEVVEELVAKQLVYTEDDGWTVVSRAVALKCPAYGLEWCLVITTAQRAGRTEEQWEELVTAAVDYLLDRDGRPEPTIHYSELNNVLAELTEKPPFEIRTDRGRWALGAVLGEVNDRTQGGDAA